MLVVFPCVVKVDFHWPRETLRSEERIDTSGGLRRAPGSFETMGAPQALTSKASRRVDSAVPGTKKNEAIDKHHQTSTNKTYQQIYKRSLTITILVGFHMVSLLFLFGSCYAGNGTDDFPSAW